MSTGAKYGLTIFGIKVTIFGINLQAVKWPHVCTQGQVKGYIYRK